MQEQTPHAETTFALDRVTFRVPGRTLLHPCLLYTSWDMVSYKAAQEADLDTRVRVQALSLATVMLGQGIAFDQQGSELLRSKSFTRDSFDSGDWFNRVDYSLQDNNYNVGMPRSSDDGSNYDIIARVKDCLLYTSPSRSPARLHRAKAMKWSPGWCP